MNTHASALRKIRIVFLIVFLFEGGALAAVSQRSPEGEGKQDLFEMSIEDLMQQEVTSSSRKPESMARTASAIYVISSEDIRQAGVTNIDELMRLVPGMDVVQISSYSYGTSVRGFAKERSRRMQILLDGRPMYDGFKGGVDFIFNPVFMDEIERIEVIRGPGGVTWGVNALSGVINIITKKAADTQGGQIYGAFGPRELQQGNIRVGGTNGPLAWRAMSGVFHTNGFGADAGEDITDYLQGFQSSGRADYRISEDTMINVTGGHTYATVSNSNSHRSIQYMNFLVDKTLSKDSSLQMRWGESYGGFLMPSYDIRTREDILEITHYFREDIHSIVWGADYTRDSYHIKEHPKVYADPDNFGNDQGSVFVEDEITLAERLWLTVGGRLHYNELTNFDWAGRAAIVWEAVPKHYFRAAVSRAFRRPLFWEEFGRETNSKGAVTTSGSDTLNNERVVAYELGYRGLIRDNLELNVEGFVNYYSDMIGMRKEGTLKIWRNVLDIKSYGVETSMDWKPFKWWLVRGSHSYEHQTEENKINVQTTGRMDVFTVPQHKAALTNRFYIDKTTTFNVQTYWTDTYFGSGTASVPWERVNPFFRVDIRLAKKLWNDNAEVAFGVNNLTDHFHYEGSDNGYEVPRQIYMQFFCKF